MSLRALFIDRGLFKILFLIYWIVSLELFLTKVALCKFNLRVRSSLQPVAVNYSPGIISNICRSIRSKIEALLLQKLFVLVI
jgi:hypothetical protein